MKKLFFILVLVSFAAVAGAQVSSHALGARFYGGDNFNGLELSYQKGLNERNRLELDGSFGFKSDNTRIALFGIYHWDWRIVGGLNWYLGPGASVMYDSFNNIGYVNIGFGGQLGIEYNFKDLPVLISLDGRPMWDFLGEVNGLGWGAAFGFRFTW